MEGGNLYIFIALDLWTFRNLQAKCNLAYGSRLFQISNKVDNYMYV